jgi:homocysteine S-methyltransferase
MSLAWLDRRLDGGGIALIDGALGTELQLRGVHMDAHAWSGVAVLSHGEVVRRIHEDYVRAGADVIITNTFASSRRALAPAGHAADVRDINRLAVALAREARERAADRPVAIAGSISTYFGRHDPDKPAEPEAERAAYREQAAILADAGVDLIALEMMVDIEQTGYALEGALATGLPVWLGLSARPRESDGALMAFDRRDTLEDTVRAFAGERLAAITVMHSRLECTAPALEIARRHWKGRLGAYPHCGRFTMPEWQFVDGIAPEAYAAQALGWLDLGVRLVGGCCGIGPAHIAALKAALPERVPGR